MTATPYNEAQLDALRELANIGSGTAGTALSVMLGRPVEIDVPAALAVPLAEAVAAVGDPDGRATGVLLPIVGDLEATVVLLLAGAGEASLCRLLGVAPGGHEARSAVAEIGNVLGSSYGNALAALTGLALEPRPPWAARGTVGAILGSLLTARTDAGGIALVLDSSLRVEDEHIRLGVLLAPSAAGVAELLARLGVA